MREVFILPSSHIRKCMLLLSSFDSTRKFLPHCHRPRLSFMSKEVLNLWNPFPCYKFIISIKRVFMKCLWMIWNCLHLCLFVVPLICFPRILGAYCSHSGARCLSGRSYGHRSIERICFSFSFEIHRRSSTWSSSLRRRIWNREWISQSLSIEMWLKSNLNWFDANSCTLNSTLYARLLSTSVAIVYCFGLEH